MRRRPGTGRGAGKTEGRQDWPERCWPARRPRMNLPAVLAPRVINVSVQGTGDVWRTPHTDIATDRRRREGGRKETGRRREGGSRRPDTRQTHTGKRGYEDQRGGRRMRSLARLRPRQARRRARPPCAPALVSASPAPRTLLFLPPWQIQESQGLSASLSEADSMSL